jgi:hypothetical protein
VGVKWRVDQLATLTGTISIYSNFEGDIGLGPTDDSGYPQYRARYLKNEFTSAVIGSGDGRGSADASGSTSAGRRPP